MSDIKTGYRVWWKEFIVGNGETLLFGTVEDFYPDTGLVLLQPDSRINKSLVHQSEVTVIKTPVNIVAAIAALPQDDAVREQVVHDLRRAVDEEDYKLMTGLAGDLGGVELL